MHVDKAGLQHGRTYMDEFSDTKGRRGYVFGAYNHGVLVAEKAFWLKPVNGNFSNLDIGNKFNRTGEIDFEVVEKKCN